MLAVSGRLEHRDQRLVVLRGGAQIERLFALTRATARMNVFGDDRLDLPASLLGNDESARLRATHGKRFARVPTSAA